MQMFESKADEDNPFYPEEFMARVKSLLRMNDEIRERRRLKSPIGNFLGLLDSKSNYRFQ